MRHEDHIRRAFNHGFQSKAVMKDLESELSGAFPPDSIVEEVIWDLEFCTDAGLLMDKDAVY